MASCKSSIRVYARWRPLADHEAILGELVHKSTAGPNSLSSITINDHAAGSSKKWSTSSAFTANLVPEADNAKTYNTVVAPSIPKVMQGGACSFFAYGHSGSGKTHTMIGYNEELGLCLRASHELFGLLHDLNEEMGEKKLGIGFSLFELRKKSAFDLLNGRTECFIREGPDGKTHIRGETEVLEGGKVRVQPIAKKPCWDFESLRRELAQALKTRAVGSSTVHDQSSRTHAVLELEIINQELVDARQAVIERQSELVPVGKRATDISIEEQTQGYVKTPDGGWASNPDYKINQERIDAAEAEKAEFEARVVAAEQNVESVLSSSNAACLGAKMVFVDLAGAEYHEVQGSHLPARRQTPQERQEGRQINTDLLALKDVMRAWSSNQPRIPFRSSALTMVLREHFVNARNGDASMIVTLSTAKEQYAATLNSLKYASLVGAAGS